ncbi:hypothetical protein VTN31DRAFT_287 [Thermomyces dupontii]|uniref:uncharacterized protein n=1 Tax=Talaromyces thermophilus TaxID=28565 RepID=UPI00374314BF
MVQASFFNYGVRIGPQRSTTTTTTTNNALVNVEVDTSIREPFHRGTSEHWLLLTYLLPNDDSGKQPPGHGARDVSPDIAPETISGPNYESAASDPPRDWDRVVF